MKLTDAKFCVDCEEIFEGANCPRCGKSVSSVSLNHWLRSLQCPSGMAYLAQKLKVARA